MPFLNNDILITLLNTYVVEDLPETKEDKLNFYKTRDRIKNGTLALFGYNTKEVSVEFHNCIRAKIEKAVSKNDANDWVDVIYEAGRAGHQTWSKSGYESKFARSAFAVRAYLLRKIYEMDATIAKDTSKNILSDLNFIGSKLSTDKKQEGTKKSELDMTGEQKLARQIKLSIDARINELKKYIKMKTETLELSEQLNLKGHFSAKLQTNNAESEKEIQSTREMIQLAERDLYYLGDPDYLKDDKSQNEVTIKYFPPPKYEYYSAAKESLPLNIHSYHLPLFLQSNYDAIFLRMKHINFKKTDRDSTVISDFEENVLKEKNQAVKVCSDESILELNPLDPPLGSKELNTASSSKLTPTPELAAEVNVERKSSQAREVKTDTSAVKNANKKRPSKKKNNMDETMVFDSIDSPTLPFNSSKFSR